MTSERRVFEEAYGRAMPPALRALYDDRELLAAAPRRVALPGKPFLVEVQYYRGVGEPTAEDVASRRFVFAVNWDGHELLVDLNGQDLPVWQRESGEVDPLEFTLVEFLAAATPRAAG